MELLFREGQPAEIQATTRSLLMGQRQVMNFTKTSGSRLFFLQQNKEDVAFCGFNATFDPLYPEIFSQTVIPPLRGYHLGSLLAYLILSEHGPTNSAYAYFRMEANEALESPLVRHHLKYDFFELLPPERLPADWIARCHSCNLYGTKCEKQVYMRLHIGAYLKQLQFIFKIRNLSSGTEFTVGSETLLIRPDVSPVFRVGEFHSTETHPSLFLSK